MSKSKSLGVHQAALDISQIASTASYDLAHRSVKSEADGTRVLDDSIFTALTSALRVIHTRSIYIAANSPSIPAHKQAGPPICPTCD
jgi:hypothetical protein